MRRTLSMILAILLVISCLPTSVFATEETETNIDVVYSFAQAKYGGVLQETLNYQKSGGLIQYAANNCSYGFGWNSSYVYMYLKPGEYAAFKINIPKSGTYKVNYEYLKKSDAIADIYIVDDIQKAIGSNLSSPVCTATAGTSGATGSLFAEGSFTALTAGEYFLVIKKTGGGWYHRPACLTLTMGDGGNDALVGYFPAGKTLEVGENVTLKGFLSSSGTPATVTYQSTDIEKAEVSETGVIIGKAPGNVTITMTASDATLAPGADTYSVELTVTEDTRPGVTATYPIGEYMSKNGYTYNEGKNGIAPGLDEVTFPSTHDFFAFEKGSADYHDAAVFYYRRNFLQFAAANKYVAFRVKVPEEGDYRVYAYHPLGTNGGEMQVYYAEANAWKENAFGTAIGTYSSEGGYGILDGSGMPLHETRIGGTVSLKAGEYIFTFKSMEAGATASSLRLDGGKRTVLMGAELTFTPGKVSVTGIMSDGSPADMSNAEISYDSLHKDVADVDDAGNITEKKTASATITASVKIGEATASASSEYKAIDPNAPGVEIFCDIGADLAANGMTTLSGLPFNLLNFDTTKGFYRFFNGSKSVETSSWIYFRNKNIQVRHGEWLAFEVFIPEAGTYDMEMWNAATDEGGEIDVFLSQGAYSTDTRNKIGSYRCYDENIPLNPSYWKDIVKAPNYIRDIRINEPGYYVFTFVGNANWRKEEFPKEYTYNSGSVGSFRLTSGDALKLMGVFPGETEADTEYLIASVDDEIIEYTDPNVPGTTQFNLPIKKLDGTVTDKSVDSVSYKLSEPGKVTIDAGGLITAIGDGYVDITANATYEGKTYTGTVGVTAYDNTGSAGASLEVPGEMYVREKRSIKLLSAMNSGNTAVVPPSTPIEYVCEPEGIVSIDSEGNITALAEGSVKITASASFRGDEISASKEIKVSMHDGKIEPTYYTYEKRDIAKENTAKYAWAKTEKANAISRAEKYLNDDGYLKLYELFPREGIPRARQITHVGDNDYYKYCKYCGEDVESASAGGYGAWNYDPINRPWKIQCPHCKRLFPSNDFELLYERGLDENGVYDADLARANNAVAVKNGEKDALRNELYPEMGSQKTPENGGEPGITVMINNGRGLRSGETAEGWGVDDGWGYRPKDENGKHYTTSEGDIEIHCYIAAYMWQFWNVYESAITSLSDAYLYTGDEKYGRAGAILLDRYADLLPEYDLAIQAAKDGMMLNNYAFGYVRNYLTDTESISKIILAADKLYPMAGDSRVIEFLSEKAEEKKLENKKSTREEIWNNWKNGILLEAYNSVKKHRLSGNFGMPQRLVAAAAVVLAEEPETTEMVEWVYAAGNESAANVTGGNVLPQLVNTIDRDGMGNEGADNYNAIWVARLFEVCDILSMYKGEANYNLWEHPKFAQMFTPFIKKILVNNQMAQIGDSGAPGSIGIGGGSIDAYIAAYNQYEGTELGNTIAQFIYMCKNGNLDGLHSDIFTRDPESIQKDIEAVADKNPKQKAEMMAGYGFAILRDGGNYSSASEAAETNNLRDAWMYFGAGVNHLHYDHLNLGLEAFGLNIAPDNGYPERAGRDAVTLQWFNTTVAHNAVTIDHESSKKDSKKNGVPLHFDDAGQVKLADVDAKCAYEDAENYRRTLVMVKVDDNNSYTLDFFRVTGGEEHTYSFHSAAENAVAVQGLDMAEQKDENGNWKGSYVYNYDKDGNLVEGIDVPYQDSKGSWTDKDGNPYLFTGPGQDPWTQYAWYYETRFPRGYTWMHKVRKDKTPDDVFAVEFEVEDYRKTLKNGKGIRLRLTQLNDFATDEVAIVAGPTPRKATSDALPENFDYLLVRNKKDEGAQTADSLFTTVFEPYRNSRYIEKIENCAVSGGDGVSAVKAVKITHVGEERVDYVVYAENNAVTYTVDNLFDFRGFVGVYSVNANGEVLFRYVNDGTIIDGENDAPVPATERTDAYTGVISGFDGEMEFGDFENYIDVEIKNVEITDETLKNIRNRWIFIENDGKQNAAYEILDAYKISDSVIRLDTGNVTNIRQYKDSYNPDEGYIYNIETGNTFRIPMSYSDDSAPEFEPVSDSLSTSAGSSVSVKVSAESPLEGKTVTYVAETLPRGASFNVTTGVFTWKPDDSQVGENHVAITAIDSDGRQSTVHFNVTVYGKTTGGSSADKNEDSDKTETPSSGSTDTPAGGGGGGGGGAAPTDKPEDTANTDETETGDISDNIENTDTAPDASGETDIIRFTDISNHAWAEDAINSLASDGIIKGTSASTFSPANNITRADFALLLVRAFDLKSDNAENFADVQSADYFAPELAIARNTGIVNGIGDNKYAPRSTITRQDMMVIVYRALQKLNVEFGKNIEPQYPDFATVAPYAQEAVSTLIGAGLVNGKSGLIAPADYTTRAEVAVLIARILDYTERV